MKLPDINAKILLAYYLVTIAAIMVILWMVKPPSGDANQLALLASFLMLFLKMAADASGYQFSSSAGSDKKDETQKDMVNKLLPPTGTGNGAAVAAAAEAAAVPAAAAAAPPAAVRAAPPAVDAELDARGFKEPPKV